MEAGNKVAVVRLLMLLVVFILVSNTVQARRAETAVAENEAKTHYMFGILGYNYTDENIVAFSVDGQGGGDVRVSTPTTGGSGIVCCILFSKNPKWPIQVLVRWQSGGCRVFPKNSRYGRNRYFYKEVMVDVERGMSAHPSDMAVHFYKDGSVRVRLVDELEPPLIKLPKNRLIEREFPECKPGDPVEYL